MDEEQPPLDEAERAALEGWPADEPPAGFADRVVGAWQAPARPSRKHLWLLAIPAVAAAATLALILDPGSLAPASGQRRVAERETIAIGRRGLAVAEAGSELGWKVATSGEATIDQTAGDVFYRVEKGGPFVVRTAAGEARVQGTCFRVEVRPMGTQNPKWLHMGIGAVAASAVLVTVYEGKVLLANEHGQTAIAAGEQAAAGGDGAPAKVTVADARPAAAVAPALPGGPAAAATREELLARDQQQRTEIEKLRARVRDLEGPRGGDEAAGRRAGGDAKAPFFAPSKDELQALAKECKLKWDTPPIGVQPWTWGQKRAEENGLSEAERLEMNRINAETNARVVAELRALYLEVTGDKTGADNLTPNALEEEIRAKSRERDLQEAFARISRERAGLQPAPADPKSLPPVEWMQRLLSNLGDQYERDLGAAIGPDRAHDLRTKNDGWGSRSQSSHGCPD
jgi:hypothetical protein